MVLGLQFGFMQALGLILKTSCYAISYAAKITNYSCYTCRWLDDNSGIMQGVMLTSRLYSMSLQSGGATIRFFMCCTWNVRLLSR